MKVLILIFTIFLVFTDVALSQNQQPNIIYILADDLGYGDLSLTGQERFSTPNINKLANDGMFFTQHYAGSTVCAPSRSALLTGQHTGNTFIRGNKEIRPEGQYPLDTSVLTIFEVLKSAGYVTGAFGKWGLGFPSSNGDPNNQGVDEFYGYNCQRKAHHYYPNHLWHNQTKLEIEGKRTDYTETYAPINIHQKAISFIERNKDTTFFMFYPSIIPHTKLAAPKPYKKKNSNLRKKNHITYATMISLLDEQVGEIRKKVEELGIAENTIIIFASDNGPSREWSADPKYFNSNANLRGYKRDLYEGGIKTPMIVYWPQKIKTNSTSEHISAFWDVLPTVCEIAQIDIPKNIDGISFLPELLEENQLKHDFLYWEFHGKKGKQAVRIGDWKGVRLKMSNNPNSPIELYNLATDISETNNIAIENPEIVKKMIEIMEKAHNKSKVFRFKYE